MLDEREWSTSRTGHSIPGKSPSGIHFIWDQVGSGDSLDFFERISYPAGNQTISSFFQLVLLVTIPNMLSCIIAIYTYTLKTRFTPVCFTPFYFGAPCKFISLLNSRPLLFGLTLFGWYISIQVVFSYGTSYMIYAHFFWNITSV